MRPQPLHDLQRRVDAEIRLDQQLLQLIPGLVGDLVRLEQGADAPEQALAGLGQAGLDLGVIFRLLGGGPAKKTEHVLLLVPSPCDKNPRPTAAGVNATNPPRLYMKMAGMTKPGFPVV